MWRANVEAGNRSRSLCCSRWTAAAVLLLPTLVVGAEITGAVIDINGAPLYRAPVCLSDAVGSGECVKLRLSDRNGQYSFNGLKAGDSYTVSIFLDRSASQRKSELYRTYTWSPLAQSAAIPGRNDVVVLAPFLGKFNYSNYQRAIELTASDFPELTQHDLAAQPVFLKVSFQPAGTGELRPETIFLGQVRDAATLQLEASLPLAVGAIDYQVFGTDFSYDGRISLVD